MTTTDTNKNKTNIAFKPSTPNQNPTPRAHTTPNPTSTTKPTKKNTTNIFTRAKNQMHRPRAYSDSTKPASASISRASTNLTTSSAITTSSATSSESQPERSAKESSSSKTHKASGNVSGSTPTSRRTTFSECGRHSNQWLFNNFSVKDKVRSLLDNNKHE